jgi:hypothetical protein
MEFLKTVGGKVVGGLVALGVVILAVSWFMLSKDERSSILANIGYSLLWLIVMLALPWATFFVITWVNRMGTNLAGYILVFAYTAGEFVLFWKLFSPQSTAGWVFAAAASLVAAVYNLFTCDWIAERLES